MLRMITIKVTQPDRTLPFENRLAGPVNPLAVNQGTIVKTLKSNPRQRDRTGLTSYGNAPTRVVFASLLLLLLLLLQEKDIGVAFSHVVQRISGLEFRSTSSR